MKASVRVLIAATASVLLLSGLHGVCFAFHNGGTGACEGCHTMHNSLDGLTRTITGDTSGYLLLGSDDSSTCLNCHMGSTGGYQVMSGAIGARGVPSQMTPGGDFAWLNITTSYVTSTLMAGVNSGTRHGHNIVAMDYGLGPSAVFMTAPGGTYPSLNLGCTSCHDPHGATRVDGSYEFTVAALGQNPGPIAGSGSQGKLKPTANSSVGVYRLLGGVNYLPASLKSTNLAFIAPPPFAFAPLVSNRSEAVTDTRVAYGNGMSDWCANCHPGLHGDSTPVGLPHPTGNIMAHMLTSALSNVDSQAISIARRYNNYVTTGNLTGNVQTSYTSMVPYEEGLSMNNMTYADLATRAVNDGSQKGGPTFYATGGNEHVMCLTCHRAHASAWPMILRWNASGQYLTAQGAYPGIDSSVPDGAYGENNLGYIKVQVQRSFYDRPPSVYAAYQSSLCLKCHNNSTSS